MEEMRTYSYDPSFSITCKLCTEAWRLQRPRTVSNQSCTHLLRATLPYTEPWMFETLTIKFMTLMERPHPSIDMRTAYVSPILMLLGIAAGW